MAEDDQLLGDGIRAGLGLEGDTVDWVQDGQAADQALQSDEFDLLVLDLGLPRKDGLEGLDDATNKAIGELQAAAKKLGVNVTGPRILFTPITVTRPTASTWRCRSTPAR